MKKIVALVLAMVMVLGLATTAFGAAKVTTYEGLYSKETNAPLATASDVKITVTPAKAATYDKTTGAPVEEKPGNIEYVVSAQLPDDYYKFVNTLAEADVVLYKDAAMKQAKFYLAAIESPFYFDGVAFTNFGEKCGQVADVEPEDGVKYYTVKGDLVFNLFMDDEDSDLFLMVGGKMVPVVPVAATKVAHTAVYEWKDGDLVSIECGKCGLKAIEAPNALSVPKGIVAFDGNWYWPVAAAPAEDTTVESPKTFDAGIAMYVGMSVMAAAGSAVVLKKKD